MIMETPGRPAATERAQELDILGYLAELWRRKSIVLGGTLAFLCIGSAFVLWSKPIYQADAIIAPKKSQGAGGGAGALLSQIGGLGGMVASELGVGNTSLEKLVVMFRNRELADSIITQHDLMPRLFPDRWDSAAHGWKRKGKRKPPTLQQAIERLRNGMLDARGDQKKDLLTLTIRSDSPQLSYDLANWYLVSLNEKIRRDTRREAQGNQDYLESQLNDTFDPVLREKILHLIANEVEKSMLVSVNSFETLEQPAMPIGTVNASKALILMLSGFFGFTLTSFAVVAFRVWKDGKAPPRA